MYGIFFHCIIHHILALWHQAIIFMSSHPLYLTSYLLYLCHHIHSIDDIMPSEFLRSHPLYMTTSYPLYMTSQPLNVYHHTHSFSDITPFVCRTSPRLYLYSHTCFIKHHVHILWHQTTLFMTSHALYSWHHSHYIWNGIHHNCVITMTLSMFSDQLYDITATLCMPSYALYTTSHPLFMTSNHCSYHITSTALVTSHNQYMT